MWMVGLREAWTPEEEWVRDCNADYLYLDAWMEANMMVLIRMTKTYIASCGWSGNHEIEV